MPDSISINRAPLLTLWAPWWPSGGTSVTR